jgi:hypothetical protein
VVEPSDVLAVLPGEHDRRGAHSQEMVDATGAGVDYDYGRVRARTSSARCSGTPTIGRRALSGRSRFYATDAAYREGLSVAVDALDAGVV